MTGDKVGGVTLSMTVESDRLRDALKQRGLTQLEVARRMGITPSQLSRMLGGSRKWKLRHARAFAMATGIPMEREEAAV